MFISLTFIILFFFLLQTTNNQIIAIYNIRSKILYNISIDAIKQFKLYKLTNTITLLKTAAYYTGDISIYNKISDIYKGANYTYTKMSKLNNVNKKPEDALNNTKYII